MNTRWLWVMAIGALVVAAGLYIARRDTEELSRDLYHPPTPTVVLLPSADLPSPTPVEILPAATHAPPVPTTVPTPTATPTQPTVPSAEEAERVVRAYFTAMDSEDYDAALSQTHGSAREQTSKIVEEIRAQERASGQEADIRVTQLQLTAMPAKGNVRPVKAYATVGAYVDLGVAEVEVQRLQTKAVFRVARVQGRPKIVDIQQS